MVDTIKSQADLLTDFADNGTGDISANDMRNVLVSCAGFALKRASDPSNDANSGFLYTKEVSSNVELFYIDSTGNVIQMTNNGALMSPTVIYLQSSAGQLTDDSIINLSNATWGQNNSVIKHIRIETTSTDWNLTLYSDSDGSSGILGSGLSLVANANGNLELSLDLPYVDNDSSSQIHLKFTDNAGTTTATALIIGIVAS